MGYVPIEFDTISPSLEPWHWPFSRRMVTSLAVGAAAFAIERAWLWWAVS